MARPGRLRLRDGRLVVEDAGGAILAEVEPDDHMTIDDGTGVAAFVASAFGMPDNAFEARISVSWYQVVGEPRGHIDVEAVDVEDSPPSLPRPDPSQGRSGRDA